MAKVMTATEAAQKVIDSAAQIFGVVGSGQRTNRGASHARDSTIANLRRRHKKFSNSLSVRAVLKAFLQGESSK